MISKDRLIRINEITDRQRSIFLYRFVFKLSNEETADNLGIEVKEVRSTYNAVRRSIELDNFYRKEIFEEFGINIDDVL